MSNMRFPAALLAALLALLSASALASVPAAPKAFYFYDDANVLSDATEGEIYFANELLNQACGAQIVVATVDSTSPDAIDDYCYELFNKWGIGDKERNNGFLLLLAIDDDDYYAICGSDLQPKFTANSLKQYFDRYLEEDFAARRYDAGVKKMFEAVFARVADTYSADVKAADGIAAYQAWLREGQTRPMAARSGGARTGENSAGDGRFDSVLMLVVVLLLIFLVISLMRRSRRRAVYGGRPVVFFGSPIFRPRPPRNYGPMGGFGPGPGPGPGGYRGANGPTGMPGTGGLRGAPGQTGPTQSGRRTTSGMGSGLLNGLFRSSGGGSGRSLGGFRSSGRSSFGARGGGGFTRGGGAGRGRH